ncbi:flap structure-specific endonuclease [Cordyceps fumosorosea ARSEF 2679]|uniref:Flap structure-specific endonuclease n=1 Tax=Cordyceps fumosorosea (strain ARSEF 2679) TaxID=1081104 RepID=A0A168EJ51_CORFA|nr:flap structure-specific endonuclease [Cordyceps fumosorosea ARSEF 2679]OAA73875.1 flap structure-specific endonuclease [Cordyceps fumosorosea ARSEF 2679]
MGIKGIYGELGYGQRVSLSKLAADTLKAEGRPLRLAIDVAIWQFQAQAAKGGTNPAIRTLFYRLVRLLAIPVQPVFIFDGPNKPTTKRNKRSGRGDGVANSQAKRLIRLFGLPALDAPGEAEAECALLQRHGIVDAVLSEDVDTIMFGCTKTLRNWSSEGKTSSAPTHVSLYDTAAVANHGLDRQGMVLVALMSGGDYLPYGIPGCGIKVACEAANAGFGSSLCSLKTSDKESIDAWRAELRQELVTNESGHFRTKHKSLHIPDDFPNMEVLRYYTHPVVSPQHNLEAIRQRVLQHRKVDLESLREFSRETFGWDYKEGAVKFIRVLGQAMLVQNLLQSRNLVQDISKRRTHFSTDATPELRLSYIPQEAVPIDLSTEVAEDINYGRDGLALNSDDDFAPSQDAAAARTPQPFDVTTPELAWVLESVAQQYAPESIRTFEAAEAAKALRKPPQKKAPSKKPSKPVKDAGMQKSAIDTFFRITKKSDPSIQSVAKEKSPPRPRRNIPSSSIDAIVTQSQELPPLLRLPRTPPRSQSKQTGASATSSPDKDAARSHMPPRPSQSAAYSEAIVISSSPPHHASPPSSTAASCSQAPASQPAADAGPVHPQSAAAASSSKLNGAPRQPQKPAKAAASKSAPKYKQTSLDVLTSRKTAEPRSKEPPLSSLTKKPSFDNPFDADSSLPSISEMRSPEPSSPSKRRSQESRAAGGGGGGSPTPSRRKKLLVPGAAGTLREVEVDVDERDEVIARFAASTKGNSKGKVLRLSDISVIDLTQE